MTSSDPGQNRNRRKGVGHSSLWVTNSYFPLVRSLRRVFFMKLQMRLIWSNLSSLKWLLASPQPEHCAHLTMLNILEIHIIHG